MISFGKGISDVYVWYAYMYSGLTYAMQVFWLSVLLLNSL